MLAIEEVENEDVYDFTVEDNHNFFANKILVHNCGEQPLAPSSACNLGPINLSNHVHDEFSEKVSFDWELFERSIKVMVIALNRMIDLSYFPLEEQQEQVTRKRQIGIGFTGLADALAKMKVKYNSIEAVIFAEQVMKKISEISYSTSADLSFLLGTFLDYDERILDSYNISMLPTEIREKIRLHGLRNSRLTSVAPTGTTSLFMNNCSSGIEPIFALEYNRNILQEDNTTKQEKVENDAWNLFKRSKYYKGKVPDYFVETNDLEPDDHINVQAVVQKWCCSAVSKTLNLPVGYDFEKFKEIYWKVYRKGIKGCTTYIPNSILGSVLEVKKDEKTEKKSAKKELNEFLGVWKNTDKGDLILGDVQLPSEYPMRGFKMTSEGKKWYISMAFKDKKCTRPFGIFVTTNARESKVETFDAIDKLTNLATNEGINPELIAKNTDKMIGQTNVNKLCRTVGLLMRHNVKLIKIIKVLDNVEVPVSSFIFRIKKFLMQWVEEIPANGERCPECGEAVVYRDGCKSCSGCFWSKCA